MTAVARFREIWLQMINRLYWVGRNAFGFGVYWRNDEIGFGIGFIYREYSMFWHSKEAGLTIELLNLKLRLFWFRARPQGEKYIDWI